MLGCVTQEFDEKKLTGSYCRFYQAFAKCISQTRLQQKIVFVMLPTSN
jgi:hypothetical protein